MVNDGAGQGKRAGSTRRSLSPGQVFAAGTLVASMLSLALALRGLTRQPIWLDEAYAIAVASQPFSAIARSLADESGPPLYYWVLHGVIALFGDGAAAVRALSVLFGVLLVPATALLGRRLAGRRAGLAAAWVIAASPMAVQFSQETRMYSLLPLLTALTVERLAAVVQEGGRGRIAVYALWLSAVCYAHNWGLLLLPGLAAGALLLAAPRPRPSRPAASEGMGDRPFSRAMCDWLLGTAAALLIYAPWIPVVRSQAGALSYLFIGMVQKLPAWQLPLRSLVLFASGVGTTGGEARSLLPGAGGLLVALGWGCLILAALHDARMRRAALALLVMATSPLAAAAVYGVLWRPIYLVGRYEVMVLPLLVVLVTAGAAAIPSHRVFVGLVVVWVAMLSALSLGYTAKPQRRFPEPLLAERLAPALREGDRVVFTGLYRAAMEYHLRHAGVRVEALSFPPDVADHLGWFYDSLYAIDDAGLAAAARAACPAPGRRIWVVASGTATCRLLLEQLSACATITSPFAALGPPMSALLLAESPGPRPPS